MDRCKVCDKKVNTFSYRYHDVYHCVTCSLYTIERIEDCCRNPLKVVVKDQRGPTLYFIRRQCINCGGCFDMTKPLAKKLYGNAIRDEFNQYRFDDWKQSHTEENAMLNGYKKENAKLNSDYYKYLAYLQSDEWKAKRLLVLARDNNLCQYCKQKPAVDIHHLTYDTLFNEVIEDLIAVCRACHAKEHER